MCIVLIRINKLHAFPPSHSTVCDNIHHTSTVVRVGAQLTRYIQLS